MFLQAKSKQFSRKTIVTVDEKEWQLPFAFAVIVFLNSLCGQKKVF